MKFNVETYFTAPQEIGHIYFEIPVQKETDIAYNQISEFCKDKLLQKYGNWEYAVNRLNIALKFLKETNSAYEYLILKSIAELSEKVESLITTTSQSILDYLIGTSPINPLIPHYYCPVCHSVEEVKNINDGFDLPKKACPKCKTEMLRDGHNCPEYLAWISKNGEIKKVAGELRLTKKVLYRAQGWLYNHIPDCESRTGEFNFISFSAPSPYNLLDDLSEMTRKSYKKISLLSEDIWRDTIQKIFDERHKNTTKGNKSGLFLDDNFYESEINTLSFYDLIRLLSYSSSRFLEEKNISHLSDKNYYLLRDELYETFVANNSTHRMAACYAHRLGSATSNKDVSLIHNLPNLSKGNMEKIYYLFHKISCLNIFLFNSLLVWYEKNYPEVYKEASKCLEEDL